MCEVVWKVALCGKKISSNRLSDNQLNASAVFHRRVACFQNQFVSLLFLFPFLVRFEKFRTPKSPNRGPPHWLGPREALQSDRTAPWKTRYRQIRSRRQPVQLQDRIQRW